MPRTSAEERSASFYRAGKVAKAAPKDLSSRAKVIWRQIVAAKPADWFDAGQWGMLADHCEATARLKGVWLELREVKPGAPEAVRLLGELRVLRSGLATSSRQLRLTVQHAIQRQATKAGERAPASAGDDLIGGQAVRGPRLVKAG